MRISLILILTYTLGFLTCSLLYEINKRKTYPEEISLAEKGDLLIKVNASNLEDAVEKALKQFLSEPDDKYINDSFEIDEIVYEEYENESFDIHRVYKKL